MVDRKWGIVLNASLKGVAGFVLKIFLFEVIGGCLDFLLVRDK